MGKHTHFIPCLDCGGVGRVSQSSANDPYAEDYPCEQCDGQGEWECEGGCDRDECAQPEAVST